MIENAREIVGVELSPDNAALLEALGIVPHDVAARMVAATAQSAQPTPLTAETVKRRLVDAAELIEHTERGVGPSKKITARIDWRLFRGVSDFERNAMAEGVRVGTRGPDRYHRTASAEEIAAAEKVLDWPARYVADEGERRVLSFWVWCDLHNAPFGLLSHKVAGSKGTAYRRLEKALARIVVGLQADGVEFIPENGEGPGVRLKKARPGAAAIPVEDFNAGNDE